MAGFKGLKVKAKAKSGRGGRDAAAIVEACTGAWDDLQEAMENKLSPEDRAALETHFNELIPDEDDLGTALFGTADEFTSRISYLEDDAAKKFAEELIACEIIDGSSLDE